jgi:hypothetical protein
VAASVAVVAGFYVRMAAAYTLAVYLLVRGIIELKG